MEMSGDAGASGFADIHAEVEAVRLVDALESLLGALGQIDELVRSFNGQHGEAIEMRVGHDHDMARGVGIGIEADEAVLCAQDEPAGGFSLIGAGAVGDGEVDGGNEVAEDAVQIA